MNELRRQIILNVIKNDNFTIFIFFVAKFRTLSPP